MPLNDAALDDILHDAESPRRFTVDEANRSLVFITRVVQDITRVYGEIVELRRELEQTDEPGYELEAAYERSMDHLGDLVDELHLVGVELKDFEKGQVEFPGEADGRWIAMLWQLGEDEVTPRPMRRRAKARRYEPTPSLPQG